MVAARSTSGVCEECARLDRVHSVAADTALDDPRVFRVYLAWFGRGLVKVGITAEERGDARLLEQGAVAFTWLGRGALMAARRAEAVLGAGLGLPDRVPYAAKRLARVGLPGPDVRAREVHRLYDDALGVSGWQDTLERLPLDVQDHVGAFGLAGLERVDGVVAGLVDGGCLRGVLDAVAGPDLHLRPADGRFVVLDARLMRGWELSGEGVGADLSLPVVPVPPGVQGGLF
ncbi:hypothetical protein GCM10023237_32330 [Streptomyces coeruleoprunus]